MARTQIEDRELIPRYIKGRVFDECRGVCAHCGNRLDFFDDFTLEHVIPLSKGGTNEYQNFVALCKDCNEAKSNDIIQPLEYYPYLPDARKQAIQSMFQEYIRTIDWLSYENLFMLDWFYIRPNKAIIMPKTGRPCFIPMKLKVQKMRRAEAFEWLQEYKASLSDPDKTLIVKSEKSIDTHYYKIMQGDTVLMIFTAFILQDDPEPDVDGMKWDHVLTFDWFVNPDVKCVLTTTVPTFYNILMEILAEIQNTLFSGSENSAMPLRLRAPSSGNMVYGMQSFLRMIGMGQYSFYMLCPEDAHPDARIAISYCIMFQGNRRELKSLMKEHSAATLQDLERSLDKKALQEPITRRLAPDRPAGQ